MKKFICRAGVGLLIFSASYQTGAEQKFVLPPETARLKSGEGLELVSAQCLLCHSADYISTQPKLTRAQWTAAVQKMQQNYAATIVTNKVEALVEYLTKNYGRE